MVIKGKKRLQLVTGDGQTCVVEIAPGTTPVAIQRALKLPEAANMSLDSIGRVVANEEDIYDLISGDEDRARVEPDAPWGKQRR